MGTIPDDETGLMGEKQATVKGLAKKIAGDDALRHHILSSGTLFVWPSTKRTGIVNLDSISLNVRLMDMVLEIWCPQNPKMKTLAVDDVRAEVVGLKVGAVTGRILDLPQRMPLQVAQLRKDLVMADDAVRLQVDSTCLRSMVTYVIRRHDGSLRHVSWLVRDLL